MISDSTGSKVMGFYISAAILLVGTAIFFSVNVLMKRTTAARTATEA